MSAGVYYTQNGQFLQQRQQEPLRQQNQHYNPFASQNNLQSLELLRQNQQQQLLLQQQQNLFRQQQQNQLQVLNIYDG